MSKRLRIFFAALIISGLVVIPLRASWAFSPAPMTIDTLSCHMVMDTGQAMQTDATVIPGGNPMPPCCGDHCDGCDGSCGAGTPVNIAILSVSTSQAIPGAPLTGETASLISSATPEPLLRPPLAFPS